MAFYSEGPRQPWDENESHPQSQSKEIEIAYILQNSQPGDRSLVDILVDSYATEIQWLVEILSFDQQPATSSYTEIQSRVIQTIVQAIEHCDQFWGEASVRNWLYSLVIRINRFHTRKDVIRFPITRRNAIDDRSLDDTHELNTDVRYFSWDLINDLSEKQYLVLLLHSVIGLPVRDIANILGVNAHRVQEWLAEIRRQLIKEDREFYKQFQQLEMEYHQGEDHKINRTRIHAFLDGLIVQNSKDAILLREHLATCHACKAYSDRLERLWEQMRGNLKERLPRRGVSEEYLEQIKQSVLGRLNETPRKNRIFKPLNKIIWIAVLLILFATGTWGLIQITPERGEFPPTPTPTQRILPTPIGSGEFSTTRGENLEENYLAAYALEPRISADGRWIVYLSNADLSGKGDFNNTLKIMLYDTHSRKLMPISLGGLTMDEFLFMFSSLDISGDGRWIVYNGVVDVMEEGDESCRLSNDDRCTDIILYDRLSNRLSRLTNGYDGSFANGYSIMPSISNNGRWIVFWSAAKNLLDEENKLCEVEGLENSCADLYIYDRLNGDLERVEIGRNFSINGDNFNNFPEVGITDDGRWLLVTISGTDRVASRIGKVGLNRELNVFLYDREQREFTPVNKKTDGTDGNGSSSYARMTPDGRYIAFYSTSDNLVTVDENGLGDIFLLDRMENKLDLITMAPDGTQANGESGVDIGMGSEIAISNDGLYVVYASIATNLDPESPGDCTPSDGNPCISIYIHDSTTSNTNRLEMPQKDHIALMPDISGDGSLISYIDVNFTCNNISGICMDLLLFDQEREWVSEITRSLFPRSEFHWELDTILEPAYSNITDIEVSPEGDSLAVGGYGPLLEILGIADGRRLQSMQSKATGSILEVVYSPDGKFIAGGASDGSVYIWRTTDGSLAYLLDNHPGRIIDLQFSANGEYLYVASPKAVWGWQMDDRKLTRVVELKYEDISVQDMDISSSDELIAIVPERESSIWIQRMPGGEVIHRLSGYGRSVASVSFAMDGHYLISQYNDGLTQIWQIEVDSIGSITPQLINELDLPGRQGKLTISSDGTYAAVGSSWGGIWIWEIPNGKKQLIQNSDRTIYITDVDFSTSGNMLAASSRDGVYIWENKLNDEKVFFTQLATDEFIQIPNRRRPLREAQADLRLDQLVVENLTYYQADHLTDFDVFASHNLPANITYNNTSIRDDGSVLTNYRVDDFLTGEPAGDLYFLQQTISGIYRPFWVGASGVIKPVEFNGRMGEYVKGNWSELFTQRNDQYGNQDSEDLYWTWSSESDVQQLRWRNLDQLFSLTYIPKQKLGQAGFLDSTDMSDGILHLPLISERDLIGIASGISSVQKVPDSEQILLNYSVKSGDTCTSIANRYDTTVDKLIRLNNLSDNCDFIVIGQTLQVPLPRERLPLIESDLNCDGRIERISYIPVSDYPEPNISYGFILDKLSDIGLYQTAWQYTVANINAEYMIRPQLMKLEGCEQLLAVNVISVTESSEAGVKVFGWDGESMKPVFTASGWLQSVSSPDAGNVTLTTLKLEFIPGTSNCNRINVTYEWNGENFNETFSSIQENSSCGLR